MRIAGKQNKGNTIDLQTIRPVTKDLLSECRSNSHLMTNDEKFP